VTITAPAIRSSEPGTATVRDEANGALLDELARVEFVVGAAEQLVFTSSEADLETW
jgi:hypothetical protein